MAKSTGKRGANQKDPTAARVAKDIQRFQKRREKALKRIDDLVDEIDSIDAEINAYLKDIPVLL